MSAGGGGVGGVTTVVAAAVLERLRAYAAGISAAEVVTAAEAKVRAVEV